MKIIVPTYSSTHPVPPSNDDVSGALDMLEKMFAIITEFLSGKIVGILNLWECLKFDENKFRGKNWKDTYQLVHVDDVGSLRIEDRTIQKLIYQDAEARKQLPHAFLGKKIRIGDWRGNYAVLERKSAVYGNLYDVNGIPLYIIHWFRYPLDTIVSKEASVFERDTRLPLKSEDFKFKELLRERERSVLKMLLTPTEWQVVELMANNKNKKEIAEILCITEWTVTTHLYKAMIKIRAHYPDECGQADYNGTLQHLRRSAGLG